MTADINLDAMTPDDLMAFWQRYQGGRDRKACAEMLGLGDDRPKGWTRVAADLANYASNKATAMQCRLRGDIIAATIYERICDQIYDRLPDYARGW